MCPTRESLEQSASQKLDEVIEIIKAQREALTSQDEAELIALDRKMELKFGEKERAFGGLRQHTKEHGCT